MSTGDTEKIAEHLNYDIGAEVQDNSWQKCKKMVSYIIEQTMRQRERL